MTFAEYQTRAVFVAMTLTGLFAVVALGGCKDRGAAPAGAATGTTHERPALPITVMAARGETLIRRVSAVGTLYPDEEIVIRAEVAGRVIDLQADTGDTVAAGHVLVRLDGEDYQHRVDQERHSLAETLAVISVREISSLEALKLDEVPPVIAATAAARQAVADQQDARATTEAAAAEVTASTANLANAEIKLREAQRNFRNGAATIEEVQDRQTNRDAMAATLASAKARLTASQAHEASMAAKADEASALRDVQANIIAGRVAEARRKQAVLAAAERDLARTTILVPLPGVYGRLGHQRAMSATTNPPGEAAPMPGAAARTAMRLDPAVTPPPPQERLYFVKQRSIAVGDYARVGDELFRLVLTHPLKLRALVPERFDAQVRPGQTVQIAVESHPHTVLGKLVYKNVVDPTNRAFAVEALIPNTDPDAPLNSGSFAKAEILIGEQTDVIMVPQEAVVSFAGVTKVFVVVDSQGATIAREVKVTPGVGRVIDNERWVEVSTAATASDATATPNGDNAGRSDRLKVGARVVTSGHSKLSDGRRVEIRPTGSSASPTSPTA